MYENKEFSMSDADFEYISKTVYEECGIVLKEAKKDLVYSRISRRIRALKLANFRQYISYLDANKEREFTEFINAITTNLTAFFREPHHFEFLTQKVVSELKQHCAHSKRVRIWSAGCSTGMEPYSIAMTLAPHFDASWDLKILATDLDTNVLDTAKAGVYDRDTITGLDGDLLKNWFLKTPHAEKFKVKPAVAELITFKQLNLLKEWPMRGPFDVIFCRNVVIYFDHVTKLNLFKRFGQYLAPHGYLILGHSETMSRDVEGYQPIGKTIYKKARP